MKRIQPLRRTAQLLTLAAIFIIPLLNVFEITFIKGTFYSMDIGDVALADPLAIFQAFLTSRSFNLFMLTSVVIPLFIVIIFGRIWCSWFCPYYLLTEMVGKIRSRLGLESNAPAWQEGSSSRQNMTRFTVLGAGLLLVGIAGIPILNLISAPGVISSQALVLVKFHSLTFEIAFILAILVLEFFFFKYWCRLICPTGSFLSLLQGKRGIRVTKVEADCSQCKTCIESCPMRVDPMTEGDNPMCHNCGLCVDNCPDNRRRPTLKFRFR